MKETGFINQNIGKWKEYESELIKKKQDPALTSKLFIQITDDLSYAQTFYNNRSVRVYLNGIAQLLFNDINRRSKFNFSFLKNFWIIDLPVTIYKIRFELLFSFLLFAASLSIGVITTANDPEFSRVILSDNYVEQTLTNIEENKPMAIYASADSTSMFLGITLNNIKVAFITFLFGIFFGIGTFFILFKNGLMVGTFQYFFIEKDLFRESFLTIWQHGTIEISSIIIAGAAGFTIGRGLILPGTYTRIQSLRIRGKHGLKVMIGLIPLFVLAGFIESFFTRHTTVSADFQNTYDLLRLISILLSLSFIIFYFVIYPFIAARRNPEALNIKEKIASGDNIPPDFNSILTNEQLFGGVLKLIKSNFQKIIKFILIASSTASAIIAFSAPYIIDNLEDSIYYHKNRYQTFLDFSNGPLLILINSILFAVALIASANIILKSKANQEKKTSKVYKITFYTFLNALIAGFLIFSFFYMNQVLALILLSFFIPLFQLFYFNSHVNNKFFLSSIGSTFALLKKNFGRFLLINLEFIIISILLLFITSPFMYKAVLEFIRWNLWIEDEYIYIVLNFLIAFIFYSITLFCFITLAKTNELLYFSLREIQSAENLTKKINSLNRKNTIRGYEFE